MNRADREAHWGKLLEQHAAERVERAERITAARAEMPDIEAKERVRRVLNARALWNASIAALGQAGRRHSRGERAAHDQVTLLAGQFEALYVTFDVLDRDLYSALGGMFDTPAGWPDDPAQAQLLALIAAGGIVKAPGDAVRAAALRDELRRFFEELRELEKTDPDAVDELVGATVSHLQSWRPVSVSPLGVLPPPTDPAANRDPRGGR